MYDRFRRLSSSRLESASSSDKTKKRLAEMGYEQELKRSLTMISILSLSFAIIAVPFGLSTTFYIGLTDGGSVTILWGWVLVTLISLCISASLAEICSVYPCAGGVYYWSAKISTPKYSAISSWITGWLTLVGNWTVTTSICFSGGQLILSAIALWKDGYVPTAYQTVLIFWAVMSVSLLVNIFGSNYLDLLNKICLWWTSATIIIIMVTLLVMANTRRSGAFVFGNFDATASGWAPGWAFFVGLLESAYTITGYGMVAAMCEEVNNPEHEVPKAMVLSVLAAGITGIFWLVPILFVLPDVQTLLSVGTGQPMPLLFKMVTGSAGGGFGLLFLILGVLFFAGVGSLTAASRCTYAFARDGAIPFSRMYSISLDAANGRWCKVNTRYDIPLNGLLLSTTICCILGVIYFGSTAAFNAFTGVATLSLSASYGLPIFILLLRKRKLVKDAPYSLGKFGYVINLITVCWIALAIVIFCMPTAIPVTPISMNYASVVFAGFTSISAIWYFAWGRKNFTGPVMHVKVTMEELNVVDARPINSDSHEDAESVKFEM